MNSHIFQLKRSLPINIEQNTMRNEVSGFREDRGGGLKRHYHLIVQVGFPALHIVQVGFSALISATS